MTEPEQWAEALWDHLLNKTFSRRQAIEAIQRAFEERERELREALRPFARIADQENRTPSGSSVLVNIDRCRDARQALATRQDAPVTENRYEEQ